MVKTKEGLPVVTMTAVRQVAFEIRARRPDDLLANLAKENPLVARAIERFVLRSVGSSERNTVTKEMVSLYELLKCQAKLDQVGN